MDIHNAQFSAGEIAKTLQLDANIMQNWLRRSELEETPMVGGRRLFSAESAIRMAILKELNLYGMGPKQAGKAIRNPDPENTEGLIDLLMHQFRYIKLDELVGDEFVMLRPIGGNSVEDVERGAYIFGFGRFDQHGGAAFNLDGKQSGLVLALGAIVKSVLKELAIIVAQRARGGSAV